MKKEPVLCGLISLVVACHLTVLIGCASPAPTSASARPVAAASRAPAKKAVRKLSDGPRVMLLINEKSLGTIATAEVESMAASMLRKRGYKVVDQDMVRANVKRDQKMLKMAGDNRGAAAVGLQFGAQIILVGDAVAKPSPNRLAESNFRAYEAAVTLNAVRTDNSESIANASEASSIVALNDVSGGAKALKTAAAMALEPLIEEMTEGWLAEGSRAASLNLTIGGVDQTWKLKIIRDMLRDMQGVDNFIQRDYTAGAVVFDVEAGLPAEDFAEQMVLNAPQGLRFQVLHIAKGKIELRAVESE